MSLVFEKQGYKLIGVAMEIYNEMGPGFLEEVYQECMEMEFVDRKIPYVAQPMLSLFFKGKKLRKAYRPDFFVFEFVVEIKAIKTLTKIDEAQLLNYLKGTGKKVGYLFNFGHPEQLQWKRMVY